MAQVKTQVEIEYIREACHLADTIFSETLTYIKKTYKNKNTLSEIQVRDYIISLIKKYNLRPSFPPIVTSGKNAGNDIHPKATNQKLKGFAIIDLGVRYNGYCSDMTRTIYVGTPSKKSQILYEHILKAQVQGVRLSTHGTLCAHIDSTVRKSLGTYAPYFIHTLGHGVGKKIHEAPMLYEKRTKPVLKEGMVITIEPGIYLPNSLGIRIEDTLLVTASKPQIFTQTSKKLVVIN